MLRPGPAVPIERPPTVEQIIDELRARLRGDPSTQPTAHSATVQPLAHRSRPLPRWTTRSALPVITHGASLISRGRPVRLRDEIYYCPCGSFERRQHRA